MNFIEVAVPVPLRQTFTYSTESEVSAGMRVAVPFGNRVLVGIVVGYSSGEVAPDKVKPVQNVLDEQPVVDASFLKLSSWMTHYYQHPVGEVYHTMLPVLLRKGESASVEPDVIYTLAGNMDRAQLEQLSQAPKQMACAKSLLSGARSQKELKAEFSPAIIKALVEKGVVLRQTTVPEPIDFVSRLKIGSKPRPDQEQAAAIAAINQLQGQFAPILLEGITGSGKTEVYLQALERVLDAGKQALILVPEIGLTPQTVARFRERFSIEVGVLHSQLNDRARLQVWQKARRGELGIIIGTRSAIFTPLKNPGMLIVDEEHDDSFKQQDGLRYHARDLAVMRARTENLPLLLGSATPSLESLANALAGRYRHLQLTRRAGGAAVTHQHILDARDQPLQFGIAAGLLPIIKQHLSAGNQVLVFVNRRGYAPALLCHHCGQSVDCSRCERPYTVHRSQHRLHCHHCAGSRPLPNRCAHCQADTLVTAGVGTEQLEEGLKGLFPEAAQVRIDSDSVRGKDKLHQLLTKINQREYQILIGTQILSKGHHFPHVTLVVVLDCDGALFSADFRAAEKLGQLVTQLAGRAGRASKPGEMWLQTHNPGHPLLQDLVQNGYSHFARQALVERKMAKLPPYVAQVVFRAEALQADAAYEYLQQIRKHFSYENGLQLIGPMPTLLEKRQGRYRFMLIISAVKRSVVHEALRRYLPTIAANPLANRVRWSLDVDPTDFS